MLDPVRFLSNLSTGQMGYTLARIAGQKKYQVTLISGPTHLKPPRGVHFVPVLSARDLQKACHRLFPSHDVLVMTAAVCDFTPAITRSQKIRRTRTKKFVLRQTPDIVAGLAKKKEIVSLLVFVSRLRIGSRTQRESWFVKSLTVWSQISIPPRMSPSEIGELPLHSSATISSLGFCVTSRRSR